MRSIVRIDVQRNGASERTSDSLRKGGEKRLRECVFAAKPIKRSGRWCFAVDNSVEKAEKKSYNMYGRQGNSNNTQPPPWLVRAEVTIRHGTPVTSESSQVPVSMSSTVTDSSGVRMIYRWNTSQSSSLPTTPIVTTSGPSLSSSSFGFQRGNIVFTSTPPPKPNYFTIPRSGSSGNDDSMSSRGRSVNVSDSGYNSGQFSPQSYSSLPSRRPSNSSSQQYNRRCKSTCSIVLSAVDAAGSSKEQSFSKIASSETIRHSYDNSWRHPSTHQHVFSRQQFSTLPEVCEECSEGTVSSVHDTHLCSSVQEKVTTKLTTVSKDASSQTTDIESYESSSTIVSKSKVRKKAATGLHPLDEQKKKKVSCIFLSWKMNRFVSCISDFSKRVNRQQYPRPRASVLQRTRKDPIPQREMTARNENHEPCTSMCTAPALTMMRTPIRHLRMNAILLWPYSRIRTWRSPIRK